MKLIRTTDLKTRINQFILLQHKNWTQSVQIKTRESSVNATSYETTLINSYLPMTTLLQLGVSRPIPLLGYPGIFKNGGQQLHYCG